MKLYLTSVFWDGLIDLLDSKPPQTNTVYIPTAADLYDDKWFIDEDRKNLASFGFNIDELSLSQSAPKDINRSLSSAELIIISGGNVFYLLDWINKTNLRPILKNLLENGVIYAGASAGAVAAGPDIGFAAPLDDPSWAPDLKSTKGIGLSEFTPLPHFGKSKYQAQYEQVLKVVAKKNLKTITLTDNQALIINDTIHTIVEFDKPPKE